MCHEPIECRSCGELKPAADFPPSSLKVYQNCRRGMAQPSRRCRPCLSKGDRDKRERKRKGLSRWYHRAIDDTARLHAARTSLRIRDGHELTDDECVVTANALQRSDPGSTRKKGRPKRSANLTPGYFARTVALQDYRCAICKTRFHNRKIGKDNHPRAMTMDRINSSRGYFNDNIQALCHTCNSTKSQWTNQWVVRHAREVLSAQRPALPLRLTAKTKGAAAYRCPKTLDIEYDALGVRPA